MGLGVGKGGGFCSWLTFFSQVYLKVIHFEKGYLSGKGKDYKVKSFLVTAHKHKGYNGELEIKLIGWERKGQRPCEEVCCGHYPGTRRELLLRLRLLMGGLNVFAVRNRF